MSRKRYKAKLMYPDQASSISMGKSVAILISVGQAYHENEKFSATIEMVNRLGFQECTIVMADTLQRHNFHCVPETEAIQRSTEMGDKWLDSHVGMIDLLDCSHKIMRWNELLHHSLTDKLTNILKFDYKENNDCKNAINTTITQFIARKMRSCSQIDQHSLFSNCLKYIIEECPIIMPLFASIGYDFILYPKPMTAAMSYMYHQYVKHQYVEKACWVPFKCA